MRHRRTAGLVLAITVSIGGGLAAAQSPMDEARALYAAASYQEALEALEAAANHASEYEVRRCRALCLLALGRSDEAIGELQALVEADPFFVPGGDDVTPRMTAAFTQARRQVLPQIIRREFVEAKRLLFQEDDAERAETMFGRVLQMLADPVLEDSTDLQDLSLVSVGFLDLIRFEQSIDTPSAADTAPPPVTVEPQVEIPAVPDSTPEPVVVVDPVDLELGSSLWQAPIVVGVSPE